MNKLAHLTLLLLLAASISFATRIDALAQDGEPSAVVPASSGSSAEAKARAQAARHKQNADAAYERGDYKLALNELNKATSFDTPLRDEYLKFMQEVFVMMEMRAALEKAQKSASNPPADAPNGSRVVNAVAVPVEPVSPASNNPIAQIPPYARPTLDASLSGNVGVAEQGGASTDWETGKAGDRRVIMVDGIEFAFRYCPAGRHTIGSPESESNRDNDETQHDVIFSHPYWMMETEVTQEMWEKVMGNNPSRFKGSNLPVECVSWNVCQKFISKLNEKGLAPSGWVFSLPTEAEWEVAARAGSTTAFPWGATLNGDKANCDGNHPYGTDTVGKYLGRTCAVKSYSPNAWGLYDTAGNVWEWCLDKYGNYPKTVDADYVGKSGSSRVERGGGWNCRARLCRSANRYYSDPSLSRNDMGVRCSLVRAFVRQQQEQTFIKPQSSDISGDNPSKPSSVSIDNPPKPTNNSSSNPPKLDSSSNESDSDRGTGIPTPAKPNAREKSSNESESDWETGKAGDRRVIMVDGIEFAFRYCPAGRHTIGSPESESNRDNDETQHDVIFSHPYWMMETEVTQEMWEKVMGNNPSRFKGSNLPVECVSWNVCQKFISKLNDKGLAPSGWVFSLPTEAEWEVAARAGSKTAFPWGDSWDKTKANNGNKTVKVGSYSANAWGLYDTVGNVWEWCLDKYGDYPKTVGTDYVGKSGSSRVLRGGSWYGSAQYCRSSCRSSFDPSRGYDNWGCRCSLARALVRQQQ